MLLRAHTNTHTVNRRTHTHTLARKMKTGVWCITLKCSFIWLNHAAITVQEQGLLLSFTFPVAEVQVQSVCFFCVSSGLGRHKASFSYRDTGSFTIFLRLWCNLCCSCTSCPQIGQTLSFTCLLQWCRHSRAPTRGCRESGGSDVWVYCWRPFIGWWRARRLKIEMSKTYITKRPWCHPQVSDELFLVALTFTVLEVSVPESVSKSGSISTDLHVKCPVQQLLMISCMSWVCPGASSHLNMLGTPHEGSNPSWSLHPLNWLISM